MYIVPFSLDMIIPQMVGSFKMGLPFPDIFGCETSFMWFKLLYVKLRRKELQPLSL